MKLSDAPPITVTGSCDDCGQTYKKKQGPGMAYFVGCGHMFGKLEVMT